MLEKPRPNRKSPRLPGYDYTQSGAYFVTICTAQREYLFGDIVGDEMIYTESGEIAVQCWQNIPHHFPAIEVDCFIVMPNHVHGILFITEDLMANDVGTRYISSLQNMADVQSNTETKRYTIGAKSGSLGAIVGTYKAAVTRTIHAKISNTNGRIWQERYHDHIIRNERSLNQLRAYIINNPAQWSEDVFYHVP